MSSSHIKVTESKSYTSSRISKVETEHITPSQLPSAPLVSFDLHFDNLKDFLNSVSQTVNQHGMIISTLTEEIRSRVTTTELIDIFKGFGGSIGDELGEVRKYAHGDDWNNSIQYCLEKIKILSENVRDLNKYKTVTEENVKSINEDLSQKATINFVKTFVKAKKKKLQKETQDGLKKLQIEMAQNDGKLAEKIMELEKKLADLELNTLWKIKDCEELLKVRVNEKFVYDAIHGIEDKIKRELIQFNEGSMSKYDKIIKDMQKEHEKFEHDSLGKFKNLKDDVKSLQELLNQKSDKEICLREIDEIKAILKSINLTEFHGKFHDINLRIDRFEDKFKEYQNKLPQNNNLEDDIDLLKQIINHLKDDIDKKVDKSMLEDFLAKNMSKDYAPVVVQEKNDMNEFWKFRERVIEQIKNLEIKVEKLGKLADTSSLKKLINTKANDDELKTGLGSHEFKINEIERETAKNSKELENLLSNLRKLQAIVNEMSQKSGFALVGRKTFLPSNCLSCGRGDANFAPVQPHVLGRDGRLYKAETGAKTTDFSYIGNGEYDIGSEVFSIDTHEQFHFRKVVEEGSPSDSRQVKAPLNVVLGKEVQKSLMNTSLTNKKIRPLSAKR